MPSANDPLSRLLRVLEPEPLGGDVFRAATGRREGRMYGGLTVSQATLAAGRTVSGGRLHSLHAYFVRPGRQGEPVELRVERLRDGRRVHHRRVTGLQRGEPMVALLASFAEGEEGISHQGPMPEAPPPGEGPEWESVKAAALGQAAARTDLAMEMRVCDPAEAAPSPEVPSRWRLWVRPRGTLPDDPLLHAAFLVFVTDRTLLRVGARPHGPIYGVKEAASLDHAVWLHRPFRFDDWLLYVCESPAAHAGRALAFGSLWSRDGARVASVAQEGIIRF